MTLIRTNIMVMFMTIYAWAVRTSRDVLQQGLERVQCVRLARGLVLSPPQHPGKSHGDARLVARRGRDRFEAELEDVHRLDVPYRPKALAGVAANPAIELGDLVVGQSGVSLRDRHERALVPDPERVVG